MFWRPPPPHPPGPGERQRLKAQHKKPKRRAAEASEPASPPGATPSAELQRRYLTEEPGLNASPAADGDRPRRRLVERRRKLRTVIIIDCVITIDWHNYRRP